MSFPIKIKGNVLQIYVFFLNLVKIRAIFHSTISGLGHKSDEPRPSAVGLIGSFACTLDCMICFHYGSLTLILYLKSCICKLTPSIKV